MVEVQGSSFWQACFLLNAGRNKSVPDLSLWLIDGCLLHVSSYHFPSVHIYVQTLSSYKDTIHIGLRPPY